MDKDVRKLITALERIDDVEVGIGGSGHYLVTKSGVFVTSLSATPSDPRWKDNALATLRRAGITPGVTTQKQSRPHKLMSLDEMATKLVPIRKARKTAEFSRFMQQLAEVRGLRAFASVDSATMAVASIANRKITQPTDWVMKLVSAGLEEWSRWQKQAEKIALAVDMPPENIGPEPVALVSPGVRLVLDLSRLAGKLAEFGIELEVQ